ncbi:MAG TPA: urease accessory protein UreE [Pseudorhodoplanes sp.]|nr:urease accessory protein UreE [Pseudorhodoplanes sp.]
MMRRVASIIGKSDVDASKVADRVVLDADDRQRRRIVLTTEKGAQVLLDLDKPVALRDSDGLVLDDGLIVQVSGQAERLLEIAPSSPRDFVRLAWHLGNRHTDVQIADNRIRIRYDHVLEEMLRGLGAKVTPLEAAFDPEAGAPHEHHHGHHHG